MIWLSLQLHYSWLLPCILHSRPVISAKENSPTPRDIWQCIETLLTLTAGGEGEKYATTQRVVLEKNVPHPNPDADSTETPTVDTLDF